VSRILVLFDATWADGSGGTARYATALAAALANEPGVDVIAVRALRLRSGHRLVRLAVNGVVHLMWTQIVLPILAWLRRADIVQTSMTAPVVCPRPVVLTLHDALDFIPDLRPSRVWSAYMRTFGALAARRATAVLTGTQASAAEITDWYRLNPARVRVTRYGVELVEDATSRCASINAIERQDQPYVLLVGQADRRKDIGTGLRAVQIARGSGIDIWAVVVGTVPDEYRAAWWVHVCSGVDDAELARLYAGALAVVVPSRHEGFGLPVVEALAYGTPVVASDLPALREVGGDATRYAPAGDASAFAGELIALAADPLAGRELVTTYAGQHVTTWSETARATIAIYRELLDRGS